MFQYDADLNEIDDGVWTDWSGSRFKIAHISNMKFQKLLARLQQPHRRKLEAGTLDPQVNRDILCKAMSEAVIVDWDLVLDSNKAKVPYTPAAALKSLIKNPEFRDFISDFAMSMANYRAEEVEEVGKPLSGG